MGRETGQDASIAFSCLSTGVYGYPSGEAAEVAGWEVRRFLEELEGDRGEDGDRAGGLGRVVFCIFEAKDERAYGEWLPYVYLRYHWAEKQRIRHANLSLLFSKIFPPTPEDLPPHEESAEAETPTAKPSTEEASAVSNDTSDEPQAKKLKTSVEDLGQDDWEAVEKPDEAASDEAVDVSEKGEKGEEVEAVKLGGSDGEEIEKPVEKQKDESKAGAVQPENILAKDW